MKNLLYILIALISTLVIFYFYQSTPETTSETQETTAKLSITNINFSSIPINVEKKASLEIINTGQSPLIIYDIETSCGCTEVKWDKKPVKPGKFKKIEIIYKDKYPGVFMKTVTVHANIAGELVCKVIGEVVLRQAQEPSFGIPKTFGIRNRR